MTALHTTPSRHPSRKSAIPPITLPPARARRALFRRWHRAPANTSPPPGGRLGQRLDGAENRRLNPGVLVYVDVENPQFARDVDVGKLALEPGIGHERRPPSG